MPLDDLLGHVLDGRYKVIEPISEGAMGVVYRGERLKLGRPVAIKVMRDQLPNELSSRKRFEVEAKAMARLEHPHCVSVLDVGLHEDKPYVVMDFITGANLRDLLDKGRLEIPRAVEMMRQILSGLGHAHELGIMHRDIKPANIMVSKKTGIGDQVKILDFGLARLDHDSQLTGTMVLGTPAYMAPEQCTGGAIDFRTDLYACGVLLFEMLTGKKPFHSEKDDPIEVVRMHIDHRAPRLDAMLPGVDFGELEAVVARALAKSPAERFQTAGEFVTALDAASAPFRTSGPTAVPQSGPIAVPASGPVAAKAARAVPAPTPAAGRPITRPQTSPTVASPARTGSTQAGAAAPASPRDARPQADAKLGAQVQSPPVSMSSPPAGVDAKFGAAKAPVDDSWALEAKDIASAMPKNNEPSFDPSWSWPSSDKPKPVEAPEPASAPVEPVPSAPADGDKPAAAVTFSEPALPENAAAIAMTPDPGPRLRRRKMMMIGGGALGGIVLIAIIASRGGSSKPADKPVASDKPAAKSPIDKPIDKPAAKPPADNPVPKPPVEGSAASAEEGPQRVIADANALIGEGKTDAALARLAKGRKDYFANPDLPYFIGRIQFSRQHYSDGISAFREAIRLDESFRTNPELIQLLVDGFTSTKDRSTAIANFLHDVIGDAAVPILERATREHPNPAMRERATKELARYKK